MLDVAETAYLGQISLSDVARCCGLSQRVRVKPVSSCACGLVSPVYAKSPRHRIRRGGAARRVSNRRPRSSQDRACPIGATTWCVDLNALIRGKASSLARLVRTIQDAGYDLPRIVLPRTWVNKGKKKGRSVDAPAPLMRLVEPPPLRMAKLGSLSCGGYLAAAEYIQADVVGVDDVITRPAAYGVLSSTDAAID